MTIALEQIRQMPVVQRIQLVEDIWDSMVAEDVDFPLSSAQLTELDAQPLTELEAHPFRTGFTSFPLDEVTLANRR